MADSFVQAIAAASCITSAVATVVLFRVSGSSRSVAYSGLLAGALAIGVGSSGYLACLFPQLMRFCIHAGAISARSTTLIALGLGALLTSLAILAYAAAKSIRRQAHLSSEMSN